MTYIRKFALAALVALALAAGGLAVSDGPPTLASFSWGSTQQMGFIDDEEVIEQVAGSAGGMANPARESS